MRVGRSPPCVKTWEDLLSECSLDLTPSFRRGGDSGAACGAEGRCVTAAFSFSSKIDKLMLNCYQPLGRDTTDDRFLLVKEVQIGEWVMNSAVGGQNTSSCHGSLAFKSLNFLILAFFSFENKGVMIKVRSPGFLQLLGIGDERESLYLFTSCAAICSLLLHNKARW